MSHQKKLIVKVITPERIVFVGEADYVSVPGVEGVLGVLPRHIPLFSLIDQGEVVVKNGNKNFLHLALSGGFVEVSPSQVLILADAAARAEELDEAEIRAAKERAQSAFNEKMSRQEYLQAQAQLRKALLDLKVATRKRRSTAPSAHLLGV